MERSWTKQQENAISSTDGSVLVSAAAGSGKTAVLVERVIRLITRAEKQTDIDRLLIVTFTKDAAAEMRGRISDALNLLLEDDPYDPNLLRQKQLLYQAHISTIHSFCSDLVREYFHTLEISPDFRIISDGELDLICTEAAELALEKFYNDGESRFLALLDAFAAKSGDQKLRETVFKIYEFLESQPFADKWLDDMLSGYGERKIADSVWGKIIIEYALIAAEHAVNLTETSIKMLGEDEALYEKLYPLFEGDRIFLDKLCEKLLGSDWDKIVEHISGFAPGRLTAPRGYKDNPIKLAVAKSRDEVKETIKALNSYFCRTEAEAGEELEQLQGLVATLFDLVREYSRQLDALKRRKNALTFSDLERMTVRLLAVPEEEGYRKTALADEISSRFDMVIVDEFQDVNEVQNLIFNCVSTDENNLFVVGDVKQSIYGFRQAKPQIFLDRKKQYNRFDEDNPKYPLNIILDKNFRSRREVCDTVNFIFSRLMSEPAARMDYTADEMLNVGAVYPESEACNTKISFIEKSAFEDAEVPELEAAYIAHEIHKMMGEGFTVTDGSVRRRATYGDFAVIMRSPKRRAAAYVHTLINCGIPAYSEEKDNCFDAQEVKILLNLLRVIDNPSVDIPLLSVMCSPIYGFTPDELAELRAQSRYSSLYQAVILYAKKSKKAEGFLNQLGSLRAYSCACTVDELIGRVLEATALGAITSSVNGGESPTRNLSLIRAYARSFESGGTKSLSDFISFADRLKENGSALPASQDAKSSINGVRVLSIHKSKGLEFPVCFIAGTAFEFNHSDLRNDVLIDSYAGLGIKRKQGICRYNTLPRIAVELEIKKNEIAEELRVLYVALTRAREKLVIVSSVNNAEKYLSNIYSKLVFERVIEPYAVTKCRSISDWITLAALTNPSLNEYRRACNPSAPMISAKAAHPEWEVEIINAYEDIFADPGSELSDATEEIESGETTEKDYAEILRKNLAFEYRNAEIMDLPQKVSASEIAHGEHIEHFGRLIAKPAFASRELSSAVERGTAHHAFLQYCDFEAAAKDISSEISRLQAENRLCEAQAKAIDTQRLSAMLNTELFSRIIHSDRVYREERFFVKLKPSEVFGECGGADNAGIIVQGAVDLAFEENGGLVILDYKTDRVRDINRLCQLYQRQLGIYKLAMEQSLEIRVKELIIVSVYLNDYISLDFPE